MNLWLVAARNVLRNKLRTLLTVLGCAVAILAFVLIRTVLSAWNVGVEAAAKDRIATRHKVTFVMTLPKRYVEIIRQQPGVKSATYANWFGGKNPNDPNDFFASFAVEPKSYLDVFDEIVLPPDQKAKWFETRRGAVIGDVLAKKLKVTVGSTITLQGTIFPGDWQFEVVGIYTAARKSVDRSQFMFQWDYLNESVPERLKDQVGWIASRIDDPGKGAAISASIDKIFDEKDIQTTTMSEKAMNMSFMGMFSAILTALNWVSIIIMLIMMMILGNTIAMGVRERTTEYGVLRAIGFSPRSIGSFVVGEAITLGILAGLAGLAISYPIVQLGMGRWLEENMGAWFPYFRIDAQTAMTAMTLSVGLALIGAFIPAWQASRLKVTDALRRVA